MLIVGIILSVLLLVSMAITTTLNKKAVIITDRQNKNERIYEINDEKLWGISIKFSTASVFTLGLLGGLIFINGMSASALFRQNGMSAVLIALAVVTLVVGHTILRKITIMNEDQGLWNFYTALLLFMILLGSILVGIELVECTVTSEQTVVTVDETVQLDSEIIPNMCIKGKGEVVAFCFINQEGTSEYDTVPASQAHITDTESEPYMEHCEYSKIITAVYPNGKVETRVASTWTEYIFYIQKEN